MRRSLLLGALAFSAAVHAFLAPEHLREGPLLGLLSRQLAPAAATVCVTCLVTGFAATSSLAGTGGGQDRFVDIPGKYFSPDSLPVLVGDTVTWTNHDSATHTVTGNEFDSGRLESGSRFSFTFSKPGIYRYHCAIHRFMHGEIDVSAVALIGPASSVPLGATVTLTGLVPGGLQSVALEQGQADGSYRAVATSSVAPDGSFSFPVAVSGPSRYRVRAGEQLSEVVAIRPQPTVTISLRRVGGRASVDIGAAPDQAGASVALERYLRERYLWKPVRRAALGAGGRVNFTVPAKAHRVRFRAHLLQGRGGWGEATSRATMLP